MMTADKIRQRAENLCRETTGGEFGPMSMRWIGRAIAWAVRHKDAALERKMRLAQDRVLANATAITRSVA